MASMYFAINCKRYQYAHSFMFMKLILEVHKAKINWLRAQLAVTEILLKVISGKTVMVILNNNDHRII